MIKSLIIQKTTNFVKDKLSKDFSGHDWAHTYRVWQTAISIAKEENADIFIVELAALLHDVADWKFHNGDDNVGPSVARQFLTEQSVDSAIINHVCKIIKNLSFKGQGTQSKMPTLEGKVVQDADRLDAIGAIGIARTFAYGAHKGCEMYNMEIMPKFYKDFDAYKKNTAPTINHFYEKLLLLKDLMNTPTASKMAQERHEFMELFLKTFFKEIREDQSNFLNQPLNRKI